MGRSRAKKAQARHPVTEETKTHDRPTKERIDRCSVVTICDPLGARNPVKVYRADDECWLDRYRRKGFIDSTEFAAGEMFRCAWLVITRGIKTIAPASSERIDCGECDPEASLDQKRGSERVVAVCLGKLTCHQRAAVIQCCGQDEALECKERVQTLRRALEAISRKSRLVTESDNNFLARRLEAFL
jgi:hypothetical protein